MKHAAIIKPDGTYRELHTIPPGNSGEVPPPHGHAEGDVGIVLMDNGELPEYEEHWSIDDWMLARHERFRDLMIDTVYRQGRLIYETETDPPRDLNMTVVERTRMTGGALQDRTTTGWRRRVIFIPKKDEEGDIIIGEDGLPEGKYVTHGPRIFDEEREELIRNLNAIPEPGPEDRVVIAGFQGREAPIELREKMSRTVQEWMRLLRGSEE